MLRFEVHPILTGINFLVGRTLDSSQERLGSLRQTAEEVELLNCHSIHPKKGYIFILFDYYKFMTTYLYENINIFLRS